MRHGELVVSFPPTARASKGQFPLAALGASEVFRRPPFLNLVSRCAGNPPTQRPVTQLLAVVAGH